MKKTEMTAKRKKFYIVLAVLTGLLIIALICSNSYIEVENITFKSADIPESFDGERIVLVSDYHNQGENFCERLIKKVKEAEPDCIFITGDIADRMMTDIPKAEHFLTEISKVAPCYLVWGNHDKSLSSEDFGRLEDCANKNGITILNNETITLERNGERISLTGNYYYYDYAPLKEEFNIWLNHFPENFEPIVNQTAKDGNKVDLIFSGHAHGGMIRLPFLGGVIGHNGLFPDYTSGLCEYEGSYMIVSRGVGNSGSTLRLFNPFHIVVCELEREETK